MARNGIKTYMILKGVSDLRGFLLDLKPQTQDRILKASVKAAAAPIVKDAKSRVDEDTGALKKSLVAIVKKNKRTGAIIAYIGAKVGYYTASRKGRGGYKVTRVKSGGKVKLVAPYKYSHLVEFGHRSVNGGGALPNYGERVKGKWNSVNRNKSIRKGTVKATSFIPARPFLFPAFKAGISNAETMLVAGFDKAVQKEFERAKRKFSRNIRIG